MISDAQMYTEVFEILSYMEKNAVMKIPYDLLEFIKKERDLEYQTQIDKNDIFNPNNISQRSINLIAWLDIEYIAGDYEKKRILEMCKQNDEKLYADKRYDNTILFRKNIKIEENEYKKVEEKALVYKTSFFENIIKFIKSIFRKD